MPTAARLAAAIAFGLVAFFAAEIYKPGLPPETQWGRFTPICAVLGMICGWRVVGRLAGRGNYAALGYGLRTSATILFFALLLFSIHEMVLQALRNRYDGVFTAIVGVFDIMIDFGSALLRPEPLIVLFIGGLAGGLLTEWAARNWR